MLSSWSGGSFLCACDEISLQQVRWPSLSALRSSTRVVGSVVGGKLAAGRARSPSRTA